MGANIEDYVDVVNQFGLNTKKPLNQGATVADRANIKGIYNTGTLSVTVPSITDLANGTDIANVAVDVSAMTYQPVLGDAVIAIPLAALPTNCRLVSATVTATDTVTLAFASDGGDVTGAAKNFNFLFFDLT